MIRFGKQEEKVHNYTPEEGRKDSFAHGLNFYKLFFVFIIGCIIGYCVEMLWCYLRLGYFESRQGLIYGPFSPVYGMGAVIFTVVLYRFRHSSSLVILLGMLGNPGIDFLKAYASVLYQSDRKHPQPAGKNDRMDPVDFYGIRYSDIRCGDSPSNQPASRNSCE